MSSATIIEKNDHTAFTAFFFFSKTTSTKFSTKFSTVNTCVLEYGCPGLARGHEPLETLSPKLSGDTT
jgi:hypothetical protein